MNRTSSKASPRPSVASPTTAALGVFGSVTRLAVMPAGYPPRVWRMSTRRARSLVGITLQDDLHPGRRESDDLGNHEHASSVGVRVANLALQVAPRLGGQRFTARHSLSVFAGSGSLGSHLTPTAVPEGKAARSRALLHYETVPGARASFFRTGSCHLENARKTPERSNLVDPRFGLATRFMPRKPA